MNPYLKKIKADWKMKMSEDMEAALEEFPKHITPDSFRINELAQIRGRYFQIESETIKGIISYERRTLELNKIRESLLDFIDRLTVGDINKSEHPELNIVSENEKKEVPKTGNHETKVTPVSSKENIYSLSDLEIFSESNRDMLTAFPKIWRAVREVIVRGNKKDERIQFIFSIIVKNKMDMEKYAACLEKNKTNLKAWKFDQNKRGQYLRLKKYYGYANDLELGNMDGLANELKGLKGLGA